MEILSQVQSKATQTNRVLAKLERDLALVGTAQDSASVRSRMCVRGGRAGWGSGGRAGPG
jgi:hypothetical protein